MTEKRGPTTVAFYEVPFTQGDFPWTYFHKGKLRKCTTTCAFVALLVVENFSLQPNFFLDTWKDDSVWARTYEEASRLHSEYFHRLGLERFFEVLHEDSLLTSVLELHEALPKLGDAFERFRKLSDRGAPICLLDSCPSCGEVTGLQQEKCKCGLIRPKGKESSVFACIEKAVKHARANAQATTASIVTAAERSFFFGIHEKHFVYSDSHHRSWTGQAQDTSMVVVGSLSNSVDVAGLLWPVLSRGDTGYSATSKASITTWTISSSATEQIPTGETTSSNSADVAVAGNGNISEACTGDQAEIVQATAQPADDVELDAPVAAPSIATALAAEDNEFYTTLPKLFPELQSSSAAAKETTCLIVAPPNVAPSDAARSLAAVEKTASPIVAPPIVAPLETFSSHLCSSAAASNSAAEEKNSRPGTEIVAVVEPPEDSQLKSAKQADDNQIVEKAKKIYMKYGSVKVSVRLRVF